MDQEANRGFPEFPGRWQALQWTPSRIVKRAFQVNFRSGAMKTGNSGFGDGFDDPVPTPARSEVFRADEGVEPVPGVRDIRRDRWNAQQVVLANLLGAAKRGQWEASAADLAQVAGRLAKSAGDHGAVCEATICRNPELTAYVEKAVAGEPGGAALVAQYRQAIANAVSATGPDAAPGMSTVAPAVSAPAPAPAPVAMAPSAPPAPPASAAAPQKAPASEAPPTVEGRVLEAAETPVQRSQPGEPAWHLRVVASLAVALFLAGWGWPMRRNLRVTRQ